MGHAALAVGVRPENVAVSADHRCGQAAFRAGCILAELYTGYPLFPGENEVEQLACIMEVCNVPPPRILESATRIKMFFDANGNPRLVPNSRGKTRRPGSKDMQMVLRTSETKYVDFLQGCLQWDPREQRHLNVWVFIPHRLLNERSADDSGACEFDRCVHAIDEPCLSAERRVLHVALPAHT